MTAITAITAQNTTGVKSLVPLNPKEIFNQIILRLKILNLTQLKSECCIQNK